MLAALNPDVLAPLSNAVIPSVPNVAVVLLPPKRLADGLWPKALTMLEPNAGVAANALVLYLQTQWMHF